MGSAAARTKLRAYRKLHRLCRECAAALLESDGTRCGDCKRRHRKRESILAQRRVSTKKSIVGE